MLAYRFDITPPARRKDWTLVPSQPRFQVRLNCNLPRIAHLTHVGRNQNYVVIEADGVFLFR
jgi:hypothetical protein